ncbi:uncharacterized protein LOC125650026 [Ostrea edulis]|uniref:uncharacterized protein LOC125650026 n=1 Tax=Ostrea edulis TaxID=37623 RepID=UPI0024AF15DD|nr:uncharacterized protein LOC125650026 [Ostrea edulis]
MKVRNFIVCLYTSTTMAVEENSAKRQRKSNWSSRDEIILVEEVQKRESLLFGKLSGPGRTASDKAKAWQDIVNHLNAGNTFAQRSVFEIKNKYQNIKQKEPIGDLESLFLLLPPSHTASPSTSSAAIVSPLSIPSVTASSSFTVSSTCTSSSTIISSTSASASVTRPSTTVACTTSSPITSETLLSEEPLNIRERRKLIKDQQVLTRIQKHYFMLKIKQRSIF